MRDSELAFCQQELNLDCVFPRCGCPRKKKEKKIVHYKNDRNHSTFNVKVGHCAIVFPIDHPDVELVSNRKPVLTSPIVRVGPWGEFETQNSIYRPHPAMHEEE